MAHLTSPNSFRSGKTFPWTGSNVVSSANSLKILNQEVHLTKSLEVLSKNVLRSHNLLLVSFTTSKSSKFGLYKSRVLYYPLMSPITRKRSFPTYLLQRSLLGSSFSHKSLGFNTLLTKLWALKRIEFGNRFNVSKPYVNLNRWLSQAMFRGSKIFRSRRVGLNLRFKKKFSGQYARVQKYNLKWRQSKGSEFNGATLERCLKLRTGFRTTVKAHNVFTYLSLKDKNFNFKNHQEHVWNRSYKKFHREFTSYFDIVNSLYLVSKFSGLEKLLMQLIQHGLLKMHRRRIKPKRFFVFLDRVIKNLPNIQDSFHAFRIIITGKLGGGTARTKAFAVGYGNFPRQTLSQNIKFEFGDVRSKYGAFGVKILTWRKPSAAYFFKA